MTDLQICWPTVEFMPEKKKWVNLNSNHTCLSFKLDLDKYWTLEKDLQLWWPKQQAALPSPSTQTIYCMAAVKENSDSYERKQY